MAYARITQSILNAVADGLHYLSINKHPRNLIWRPIYAALEKDCRELMGLKGQRRYYASKVLRKLIDEGYIVASNDICRLSGKGFSELERMEVKHDSEQPRRWDGKYRLVIFDIAEDRRRSREQVRRKLIDWGFVRLQNSVWAYPYDCEKYIAILKSSFGLSKDVLYLTAEAIENDRWLRKEFGLE